MSGDGHEEIDISPEKNGGVMKTILEEGTGSERPGKDADVNVHYVGTLVDGSKFDSSRDRGEPFSFKLGTGGVIKGWDIGVATMRKGEVCRLRIASDFGYGEHGSPPKIPGGATLIFEVELLSWKEGTDISEAKDGSLIKKRVLQESEKSWIHPVDDARVKMRLVTSRVGERVVREGVDFEFVAGAGEDGMALWERAASQMGKGERCLLVAPADSKYLPAEERAAAAEAGGAEPVALEVELPEFEELKMSWDMSPEEKVLMCERLREEGNAFFKAGNLRRAMIKYERAARIFEYETELEGFDKAKIQTLRVSCLANQAAVHLKRKEYKEVISACKKVLDIDKDHAKSLFRRGQAHLALANFDAAERDFLRCKELAPEDKGVAKELEKLKLYQKKQDEKDKKVYSKMLFSE